MSKLISVKMPGKLLKRFQDNPNYASDSEYIRECLRKYFSEQIFKDYNIRWDEQSQEYHLLGEEDIVLKIPPKKDLELISVKLPGGLNNKIISLSKITGYKKSELIRFAVHQRTMNNQLIS